MTTAPSLRRRERVIERDSVLRASILDTALELGVGDSSAVARWMFSPVQEVDEDVESMVSPSLTYASTATSEESAFFASNFRHHRPGAGASASNSMSSQTHSLAKSDIAGPEGLAYTHNDGITPDSSAQRAIHFHLHNTPEPPAPSPMSTPVKSGKLRKARPDGYESDGGYVSDGTKGKKDKDKKKSKKKANEGGKPPEEESDGGYLSEISFRRKKKDKKSKTDKTAVEKTMTDGESDGGYISMSFGRGKKERAAAKAAAATTPVTADESDGAYLSESSIKKRSRFFRLNGKSSRKKNSIPDVAPEVPPVPSLPPMQLRIADMFSRSITPMTPDECRTENPAPSEHTVLGSSTHSTSVSSIEPFESSPSPLLSSKPITNVFIDAESVRSPSTDLLATFSRRHMHPAHSPTRGKAPSVDTISSTSYFAESPIAAKPTSPLRAPAVPMLSIPKPKKNSSIRATPQISAPNTHALAAKHTPVPLILTPPTPAANAGSFERPAPVRASQSSDSSSPWDRTLDAPRSPSPSPFSAASSAASPQPSPTAANSVRPHVLAYYDLPPPSPPPSGPLPRIPPSPQSRSPRHDWSQQRAPSPVWKTDLSPGGPSSASSSSRSPHSASASPLFLQRVPSGLNQHRGRESPFPVLSASSLGEEPSSRLASNLRGRESPFPTQPVLPREESAELVRRTSIARLNSPTRGTRPLPVGTKKINISGPMSADAFHDEGHATAPQQTLDAHWQPRSASALDTRPSEESRRSWIDYDDATLDYHRASSDEQADSQEGSESVYHNDERDPSGEHTRHPAPEPEERSTQYYDAEESDGEVDTHRYSAWSAKSRISILDRERSGNVRQKFVQRVEAMYGKSSIPPVPKLPPSKPGMF